jgi:hypothetical protein
MRGHKCGEGRTDTRSNHGRLGNNEEEMRAEDVGSCHGYPDLEIPMSKYGRYRPERLEVPQFVDCILVS